MKIPNYQYNAEIWFCLMAQFLFPYSEKLFKVYERFEK